MPETSDKRATAPTEDYEKLLLSAQHAQAAADAAVAELASLRRRLAEAPRVLQQRTEELTRARLALEKAESEVADAKQIIAHKQADAARLIEAAAHSQQALARALISQDSADPAALELLARKIQEESAPARPMLMPLAYDRSMSDAPRAWAPPPSATDLNAEIAAYMADRDALCPSCGSNLRGITSARCPSCRLQLSIPVLKTVAPRWWEASSMIWAIRAFALVALALTLLMMYHTVAQKRLPGCGVDSECDVAFTSPWSKVVGIPVVFFAVPLFATILAATFRTNMAHRDGTRRGAWMLMSALGLTVGGAGLWFLMVQLVIYKAICPYCVVVDAIGLVLAGLIYFKAPLNRPESVPPRATGAITIAKPVVLKLAGASLACVLALAGVQLATKDVTAAPVIADDLKKQNDAAKQDPIKAKGLLMGGVEVVPNDEPRESQPPQAPVLPQPPREEPFKPNSAAPAQTDPSAKAGPTSTPSKSSSKPEDNATAPLLLLPTLPKEQAK